MKIKLEGDNAVKKLIEENKEDIIEFCRDNYIDEISLFGSVLTDDFDSESDIDILVRFQPSHTPGFFDLIRMEDELSSILGERTVDLRTPADLSRYFRSSVIRDAEVIYAK